MFKLNIFLFFTNVYPFRLSLNLFQFPSIIPHPHLAKLT